MLPVSAGIQSSQGILQKELLKGVRLVGQKVINSPSPALRTATSTETAQDDHPGITAKGQVLPPLGVLNLQSPVVKECYNWIENFKSGVAKRARQLLKSTQSLPHWERNW